MSLMYPREPRAERQRGRRRSPSAFSSALDTPLSPGIGTGRDRRLTASWSDRSGASGVSRYALNVDRRVHESGGRPGPGRLRTQGGPAHGTRRCLDHLGARRRSDPPGLLVGFSTPFAVLVESAAIATMLVINRRLMPALDRRIRGNQGEQQVGAILDALTTSGWLTLHDVTGGRGNIDHVLVGPGGVFTIETKSHGGRRSVAAIDPRWLKQAYAQRKLVERLAERQVEALLVFSRAYLDRPVSRQRGVVVLPARMLAGHLERRPVQLSPEEVRALHARLATAFS